MAVPPHLDIYARQRAQKLDLIPRETALYSPRATIVHSLEFLGDQADLAGLEAAQGQNGALGNSPAATAFYLAQTQSNNPQALDYLELLHGPRRRGATAPVLHPCDTFELLWAAYHLYVGGAPSTGILRATERRRLLADLAQSGVSLSRTFPIPDADDTAVALLLMHDLGERVDPRVLQPFEAADGSFVSFPYERHSSVGVNAHVLHTLTRVPGYPDASRAIERILTYLIDQHSGLYWIDKWHISPLYATAHVLAALENLPPEQRGRVAELIDRSREWLRQSQNADGSWGFYGQATAEETAYGLLALAGNREIDERDRAQCAAAARFLKLKRRENIAHPPLWVDKCLYVPPLVVNAAIVGALTAWNKRVVRKETRATPESLPPYQYSDYHAPADAPPTNHRRAHAAVVVSKQLSRCSSWTSPTTSRVSSAKAGSPMASCRSCHATRRRQFAFKRPSRCCSATSSTSCVVWRRRPITTSTTTSRSAPTTCTLTRVPTATRTACSSCWGAAKPCQSKTAELLLGQWQRIFLVELDGPRPQREVLIQTVGVSSSQY